MPSLGFLSDLLSLWKRPVPTYSRSLISRAASPLQRGAQFQGWLAVLKAVEAATIERLCECWKPGGGLSR